MNHFSHSVASEAETTALAAVLAQVLPPGAVVVLSGPLGAGKTRLVQALAEAVGFDRRNVTSPTFTLIHEYAARTPIYHFDVYRLRDEDEFRELGPDEYFEAGGWVLIEWGEKVAQALPAERLEIQIELAGPGGRKFSFHASGKALEGAVAVLARRLAEGVGS